MTLSSSANANAAEDSLELATPYGVVIICGETVCLPSYGPITLPPGPLSVFRVLLRARGAVVSREHLLLVLPECSSIHRLHMWVSRLRRALPDPEMIRTVVKRGYCLSIQSLAPPALES